MIVIKSATMLNLLIHITHIQYDIFLPFYCKILLILHVNIWQEIKKNNAVLRNFRRLKDFIKMLTFSQSTKLLLV